MFFCSVFSSLTPSPATLSFSLSHCPPLFFERERLYPPTFFLLRVFIIGVPRVHPSRFTLSSARVSPFYFAFPPVPHYPPILIPSPSRLPLPLPTSRVAMAIAVAVALSALPHPPTPSLSSSSTSTFLARVRTRRHRPPEPRLDAPYYLRHIQVGPLGKGSGVSVDGHTYEAGGAKPRTASNATLYLADVAGSAGQ